MVSHWISKEFIASYSEVQFVIQNRMNGVSTLVSNLAMILSGRFCIVQTLPRKVPVAVLMMSGS